MKKLIIKKTTNESLSLNKNMHFRCLIVVLLMNKIRTNDQLQYKRPTKMIKIKTMKKSIKLFL
jgi:hypothetical protein